MRVPVSWLREYAPIPEPYDALEVGRRLTQAGLEVEAVEQAGHDVHGVLTAQVITVEDLPGFKKPIRYCRVAVSDAELTAARSISARATGWPSPSSAPCCPAASRSPRRRSTAGRRRA
jgi:hypothetical protein